MLYLVLLPPVILGGIFDLRKGIIPNHLTFTLIASGLVFNIINGNAVMSVLGFGVAFAIGYFFWNFIGGIGGGDVKLIAGIGAWLGLYPLTVILLFSSLFGLLWFALRFISHIGSVNTAYTYLKNDVISLSREGRLTN